MPGGSSIAATSGWCRIPNRACLARSSAAKATWRASAAVSTSCRQDKSWRRLIGQWQDRKFPGGWSKHQSLSHWFGIDAMCGIAGMIDWRAATPADALRSVGEAMIETVRHRGPDAGDVWVG